jgi:hypothetical protein
MNAFLQRHHDILKTIACLLAGILIGVTVTLEYPLMVMVSNHPSAVNIATINPTPTYGYEPKVEPTIELVRSWCTAGDGTALPCDINHFHQLEGAVLFTIDENSHEYFNIHKVYPGIMVVRVYRGGGFKGYPYWDIITPSASLVSGQTILFTTYLQLDKEGRIVTPVIPEGTQP